MKRHMQSPEGAGRNFLSVFCCNYYMIKILAEPFLNSTRGVQDMVDNTTECVQMTRSRLSCTEFLSSANLTALPIDDDELESGRGSSEREKEKKAKKICGSSSKFLACLCTPFMNISTTRIMHIISILCAIAIVVSFIYASFTV